MSTLTVNHKPSFHLPIRDWIVRHPATAYVILAFAFAWTLITPLLLGQQGFGLLPFELPITLFQFLASLLGLALPAFLVTAATDGKAGVQALLRRFLRWRVGVHWYLIALVGTFVASVLIALPFVGVAPLQMVVQKWSLFFTVLLPSTLVPFLHTNLPEEIGWTGYLQAKLQARHGPIRASLMVAPFFALVHLPAYFIVGWIADTRMPVAEVILTVGFTVVFALFFRPIIMWLYNGTGGSLIIVGLFHSAFNVYSGQTFTPEFIQGLEPTWRNLLVLAAVALSAVFIIIFTRGRLSYQAAPRTSEPDVLVPAGKNNRVG